MVRASSAAACEEHFPGIFLLLEELLAQRKGCVGDARENDERPEAGKPRPDPPCRRLRISVTGPGGYGREEEARDKRWEHREYEQTRAAARSSPLSYVRLSRRLRHEQAHHNVEEDADE